MGSVPAGPLAAGELELRLRASAAVGAAPDSSVTSARAHLHRMKPAGGHKLLLRGGDTLRWAWAPGRRPQVENSARDTSLRPLAAAATAAAYSAEEMDSWLLAHSSDATAATAIAEPGAGSWGATFALAGGEEEAARAHSLIRA
jgi:hypothetical protein